MNTPALPLPRRAFALLLLVCAAATPTAPALAVGDARIMPPQMPDMPLHDPWIVADQKSGTYYLFTSNEPAMSGDRRVGVMVYASRDLKYWQSPRLAFVLPPDAWANDGALAPEVHLWKGRWYLFSTFFNEADKLPADGPYTFVRYGAPIVDPSVMTLDGTLELSLVRSRSLRRACQ